MFHTTLWWISQFLELLSMKMPAPLRQHEAREPDEFPPSIDAAALHLGAGECGDANWECSAQPGGLTHSVERAEGGGAPQPAGGEGVIRGGRFIDLVERRRPREQRADG